MINQICGQLIIIILPAGLHFVKSMFRFSPSIVQQN